MSSIKAMALAKIVGGGGGDVTIQSLSVTQNGTYNPGSGKAYKPVVVNVANSYSVGDEGKIVVNGQLIDNPAQGVNF